MIFETILLEKPDNIARITLNRPRAMNAMSRKMLKEVQQAVTDIKNDPKVKVVILSAAGDRAFCAGTDMKEMAGTPGDNGILLHETLTSIRNLPKPVVCAVKGYCLGSGLDLMLSSDLAIAGENALFGMPEINVGVVSNVEAAIMSRAMSIFRAKEMCLLGDHFDAQKAERCGLVNEVVPLARLEARVNELANKLASKDATALAVQKDVINKWLTTDLETAMDYSIIAHSLCHGAQWGKKG
jgi:enoyl-CoA hydratase/carnithine racemase